MYYHESKALTKDKQQQLRREANTHRLIQQARGNQGKPGLSIPYGKLTAVIIILVTIAAAAVAFI